MILILLVITVLQADEDWKRSLQNNIFKVLKKDFNKNLIRNDLSIALILSLDFFVTSLLVINCFTY